MALKDVTTKVKNNYIGTIVGAGVTFWAAKKYLGVSGTWKLVAVALVGGLAGAYTQGAISAKRSTPKAGDIKK